MALSTATGAASFDRTANTFPIDLSMELSEVIRPDNEAFLSRVGASSLTASQRTHYWVEDKLNPNSATEDGTGINSSVTSVTVASGQGGRFKAGTLFRDAASGKTEVMRVTAVSTDTLTIERGHGSTSGEAHAASFTIHIIGHTKQEGWKPTQEDWTQERTSVYNYLSTVGRGITLTRVRQLVNNAPIASELAHQSAYRLREIGRELDSILINGIRSASAGSDTDYGSSAGLIEYVSASGGNTDTTSESFTEAVVNDMFQQIWNDAGGLENGFILMGGALKRVFATFDQAYRRSDFNARTAGFTVDRFLTDMGTELECIVDPWMPADVVVIGDLSKVRFGPLMGDGVALEELAKTGRTIEYMVSGSYTAEVRNALDAFAYHNNLS